jgi:hypothetical protein
MISLADCALNSHLFHHRQDHPILASNKKSGTKLTKLTKLSRFIAAYFRRNHQSDLTAIRFAYRVLKSVAAPKYRAPFSTVYLRFLNRFCPFSTVFTVFRPPCL